MFFFLPLSTDAPIYHGPWATVSLIAVNTAVFFAAGPLFEPDPWVLAYGTGLHPLQWITSNFLHEHLLHLAGNMYFLWLFGLIVEGKIGWWRFMAVYFGIGVVECAIEQSLMGLFAAGAQGGSQGASSIVFGLLGMALVWAPRNEVTTFYFVWVLRFWTGVVDVTIQTYAMVNIGWEIFIAWLHDFGASSGLLHLAGAAAGFAVATVMLKRGWVDCENWDLFAVLKGTHGRKDELQSYHYGGLAYPLAGTTGVSRNLKSADEIRREEGRIDAEPLDFEEMARLQSARQERALRKMHSHLKAGKPQAALAEYQRTRRIVTHWQLGDRDLSALKRTVQDALLVRSGPADGGIHRPFPRQGRPDPLETGRRGAGSPTAPAVRPEARGGDSPRDADIGTGTPRPQDRAARPAND